MTKRNIKFFPVGCLILALTFFSGCSLKPKDAWGLEGEGNGKSVDPSDRNPEQKATNLYPSGKASATFRIEEDGESTELKVNKTLTNDGTIIVYVGDKYETRLKFVDGALHTIEENDKEEQMRVEFAKPLLTLPATLKPGQTFTDETEVKIVSLSSGKTREQGKVTVEGEVIGWRSVPTAAGEMEAYVVKVTRVMDLRFANVTLHFANAYLPGQGLVAKNRQQQVKVLGAFPRNSTENMSIVGEADTDQDGKQQ